MLFFDVNMKNYLKKGRLKRVCVGGILYTLTNL